MSKWLRLTHSLHVFDRGHQGIGEDSVEWTRALPAQAAAAITRAACSWARELQWTEFSTFYDAETVFIDVFCFSFGAGATELENIVTRLQHICRQVYEKGSDPAIDGLA